MCYLSGKAKKKKSPFLAVTTWFPILSKFQDGGQDGGQDAAKMATIVGDNTGLQQGHHP